jgi:hypothetical protein
MEKKSMLKDGTEGAAQRLFLAKDRARLPP